MWNSNVASNQITRHPLYGCHIVVQNGLLAAIIPFDGYARPILFSDGALITQISIPKNTVADIEGPGLVAGHCLTKVGTAPRLWSLSARQDRKNLHQQLEMQRGLHPRFL